MSYKGICYESSVVGEQEVFQEWGYGKLMELHPTQSDQKV